jgi:hypothetical protein
MTEESNANKKRGTKATNLKFNCGLGTTRIQFRGNKNMLLHPLFSSRSLQPSPNRQTVNTQTTTSTCLLIRLWNCAMTRLYLDPTFVAQG